MQNLNAILTGLIAIPTRFGLCRFYKADDNQVLLRFRLDFGFLFDLTDFYSMTV